MDDILGDDIENTDEEILEPQIEEVPTNPDDLDIENKDDEAEEEKEKKVKPKRVVKNPRVTLNIERLKGAKGISVLESCFEKILFKGKGHEEQDLNLLLKTYEYWCHRLFPKFSFEDSIARIEKLGGKGPIQTHLKKVRSGMIEDEAMDAGFQSDEKAEVEFETTTQATPQSATQAMIENIPIELTEEQLETIRRNRAHAAKLRLERLKKIQEKFSLNCPQSVEQTMEVPSTSFPINRIQDAKNEVAENENNSVRSKGELSSNDGDFLEVRDNTENNIAMFNTESNKECESNEQNIEKNNIGTICDNDSSEKIDNDLAVHEQDKNIDPDE